jgi:hypothetical protein
MCTWSPECIRVRELFEANCRGLFSPSIYVYTVHVSNFLKFFFVPLKLSANLPRNFLSPPFQAMKASQRPVVQGMRRLAAKSAFWSSTLDDYRMLDPVDDVDLFKKELEAISAFGDIDLPPNTVKCVKHTRQTDFLHCHGYTLTNRYVVYNT